ncbi:MAG: hypothetical protein RIR51_322 [Bacteroidota bacterium]|jgi:hypothetical protein
MPLKKLIPILLLFILNKAFGQTNYRYLIEFKDKNNSSYSVDRPAEFLSQKAIDRRTKNSISITQEDLPVNANYLEAVIATGAKVVYPLKWVNGAVIQANKEDLAEVLANQNVQGLYFPFPLDSIPGQNGNSISEPQKPKKGFVSNNTLNQISYGNSSAFITQLRLDSMHADGFTGEGIIVALLDGGFDGMEVDTGYFENVFDKIVDTLTTYPGFTSPFHARSSHGMNVFSALGINKPGNFVSGLFDAKFALAQTEEDIHELLIEEVNWMRGAEWADSLGADLINSSLGYSTFDNSLYNHTYNDLDGNTIFVTKAAALASKKGIVVLNSAGNSGNGSWKYINAPADGMDVLAVGATLSSGAKASFSSFGPSADGRIKPDISALGANVTIVASANTLRTANGTSFSSPVTANLVGGLIQAYPRATSAQIREAVRMSGSLNQTPNNELGYGIPNWLDAKKVIEQLLVLGIKKNEYSLNIYPNPTESNKTLTIEKSDFEKGKIEIISLSGQSLFQSEFFGNKKEISLNHFPTGKYLVVYQSNSKHQALPLIIQ